MSTFVAAIGADWELVAGQLLASGVLMLSVSQDIGLRAYVGATLGFCMAIAFGISALVTALRAGLRWAAGLCAVVLFSEVWLIVRRRNESAPG